jgi:hypothetical protein
MKFPIFNSSSLKNIFHRKPSTGIHLAHRDWLIILSVFGLVFASILLVGIYIYRGISNGTLFVPSPNASIASVPSIDRATLVNTMSYYTDKATKLENLKTVPLNLIDPSL